MINHLYSFRVKEVEQDGEVVYTISTYNNGKMNVGKLNSSIDRVKSKIAADDDILSSEIQMASPTKSQDGGKGRKGSKTSKKSKKGGARHNTSKDSEEFDKILEELDDDDEEIFPKKKRSSKTDYITELIIPNLVNPITYYWYTPVYEISRVIIPQFIPTIVPRVIIDFGDNFYI